MITIPIKEEIINLHKNIYLELKNTIDNLVGKKKKYEIRYENDYTEDLKEYDIVLDSNELINDIIEANIVYFGDYHTLQRCYETLIRIIDEVIKNARFQETKKGVILALEMFYSKHQELINNYLLNNVEVSEFLEKIEYEKKWGINWSDYKSLFEFVRTNNIRIFGLNTDIPDNTKNPLRARDKHAAKIITNLLNEYPNHLIVVLYGELHTARNHIPKDVLSRSRNIPKQVIIYQNCDNIYWDLIEKGKENIKLVKINYESKNENLKGYCIINTTPVAKLQSFINWWKREEELKGTPYYVSVSREKGADNIMLDYTDEVCELIRTLTTFFELYKLSSSNENAFIPQDLTVITIYNPNFIKDILSRNLPEEELKKISIQISKQESYFLPKLHTIFLTNLSINHASEEAMHYIHLKLINMVDEPKLSSKDLFYFRVIYEGIGFLGSKIINPLRKCYKLDDYYAFAQNKNASTKRAKEILKVAKKVITHNTNEIDYLKSGTWKPLRKFYTMEFNVFVSLTHALGYILGDNLFEALSSGSISKNYLKDILSVNIHRPNKAFTLYLSIIKKLNDVNKLYYT